VVPPDAGVRVGRDPAHEHGPRRTKQGYDIPLTRTVAEAVTIPVIASGGVGSPEHLLEGLTVGKADAVLAASIFHYEEFSIAACKKFLTSRGVHVR
jgi:cyclase